MSHYFTDNRNLKQNRREIPFRFLGVFYTFITDNGVFSKSEVDFGTWVLLKTICGRELGSKILDLGCGYGPVGVVLKTVFKQAEIISVDVNPRAVELAELNAAKNNVELKTRVSNVFSNVPEHFSAIVVNPPIRAGKAIIYEMFDEAFKHLETPGSLYVVIRKAQGANSALTKLKTLFSSVEVINKKNGYWIIEAKKS